MLGSPQFPRGARWVYVAVPVFAALTAIFGPAPSATAFPIYTDFELPNYATDPSSNYPPGRCITCHNNPNGGLGCEGVDPGVFGGNLRPCLNPFGTAFKANNKVWTPALATADSDGDGFTNGQELQEPSGTWSAPSPSPGRAAYVTRPGFASSTPGAFDGDMDGYCWAGQDLNGDRDCLDPGEKTAKMDCDDGNPNVSPGAMEICTNTIDDDCDGLDTIHDPECASVVDSDGDGYCPSGRDLNGDRDCLDANETGGPVDCDDTNPARSPARRENCTDGIDNDCDGKIDTTPGDPDLNCTPDNDGDGDGYCPIGQDLNADGDCLDDGEGIAVGDCDDYDELVSPGANEVCGNGADDDCDGLIDFADSECAAFADADGDGRCQNGRDLNGDGDCIDANEDGAAFDCDDADPYRYEGAVEICTDDIDQDCDGAANIDDTDCAGYLDADDDDYCAQGIDLNNDGDCIDLDEEGGYGDCDDSSPLVNPAVAEVCTNGIDDDCNDLVDAADPTCSDYADFDWDGYCAVGFDGNGDRDCADAGEQTGPADAAPHDGTIYPGAPENCIDHKDNDQDALVDLDDPDCRNDVDVDGDGYCPYGRDLNGDRDCNDANENWRVSDCNDQSTDFHPGIVEGLVDGLPSPRCSDRRDNDCDGDVDLFDEGCFYVFDLDGDGFCGFGIDYTNDGDCLDASEDEFGADCDDDDDAIRPGGVEVCDDGIDNDCDGAADAVDSSCGCHSDAECTDAQRCETGACQLGACVYTVDPSCGGKGCSVPTEPGEGASLPLGVGTLLAIVAVALRRRRRSRT